MGIRSVGRRWWPLATILAWFAVACSSNPTETAPVCGQEDAIRVGDIVGSRLESGDDRFAGAFIDYYSLELGAPTLLTVSLSSEEMDPLLLVFAENPDTLIQAFDSIGEPPGATETATWTTPDTFPLLAGCHLIGASSWYPDGVGAYAISVSSAEPQAR